MTLSTKSTKSSKSSSRSAVASKNGSRSKLTMASVTGGSLVAPASPSKQAYDRILAAALGLAESDVRKLRAHVTVVTTNGTRGVDVILGHEEEVKAAMPQISFERIRALGDQGGALVYAHNLVLSYAPVKTIRPKLARGRKLRAKLMRAAAPLVEAGLFPAEAVARIREGRGSIDAANDLLSLDTLYRAHWAAISGKTTITPDEVQEAGELGGDLLAQLQTAQVKKVTDKQLAAATDIRDRMWTLYENTWEDHVWRAGAWLFGRAVDDNIPVLQAHVGHKRKPVPTPAPTPTAPTTPTPAPTAPTAPPSAAT